MTLLGRCGVYVSIMPFCTDGDCSSTWTIRQDRVVSTSHKLRQHNNSINFAMDTSLHHKL